ncbi:MAG: uracil-DNA glycosylase [Flavobacteriales bacterium]|nr:uracil-DNA glycosylase [Flavobacteriales bacterium]
MPEIRIESSWKAALTEEWNKPYFKNLQEFVKSEYSSTTCYPKGKDIFRAFDLCPINKIKVVIIGQDPYINPDQAMGLCFSVPEGQPYPPSLRNIYQELEQEGISSITNGDLSSWAEQGVFLLNATLTVRAGLSASHQGQGWEQFTDAVISKISEREDPIVFLLWGGFARKKKSLLKKHHHVLEAPHPSPLSAYRGFFGCNHFIECNAFLENNQQTPIQW